MPPILGVGLRFMISGLIFWAIFLFRKEKLPLSSVAIKIYLQFGLINFSVSYAITYWATQFIYSNLSSIIWALFPLIVTAMAHFTLPNERFNSKKLISIILGITGTLLIVSQGDALGGRNVVLGIVAIFISVVIAAWPNVYLKKHANIVNTIQLNAVSQTIGGILLFTVSKLFEPNSVMVWSQTNVLAIIYLIVCGSVITWMIYFWLFNHLSVSQISYVAFFPPVIAIIVGWIILDEILTPFAMIGAALILFGALIINYRRTKPVTIS